MNYNSLWIICLNCCFLQFNPLNYSETYSKLDSEEATVCTHCGSGFILFMYVYRAFDTSDMTNKLLKCNLMYWYYIIFVQPYKVPCSIQHRPSTPPTYPGSSKTCFFYIPGFDGKSFLIFPIIDLTVDLKLICIIGLSGLVNSLIFADCYPGWHNYSLWGLLFHVHRSVGS